MKYGGVVVFKSQVVKKNLYPDWNENATLSPPSLDDIIKVVRHLAYLQHSPYVHVLQIVHT